MAADTNIYQQVALYLESMLPLLENLDPIYKLANKKFHNFNDNKYSYGDTVTFELPSRVTVTDGLAATFQQMEQRKDTLTVDRAKNGSYVVDDDNHVFTHQERWKDIYGRSFVEELGTIAGADIGTSAATNTYRAFGDGVTPINSYQQLAQMLANLKDYGSAKGRATVILPNTKIPAIIGDGLTQFATSRNNEISNSWELGSFSNADFYSSNLLPEHKAGTAGEAQDTLTITGINAAGTQLTVTGVSTDTAAFLQNDIITLDPNQTYTPTVLGGVGGRFLTFIGHTPSSQKVQVRVTDVQVDAVAGTATVNIFPALNSDPFSRDRNVNFDITAVTAMEAITLPSHVCGLVWTSNPLFCSFPQLPKKTPFPTGNKMSSTGISMRLSFGALLTEGQIGYIYDMIYGFKLVDEYAMRIAFPL